MVGRAFRATSVVLLLFAGVSLSAQTTDLLFANRTGATIYFLYASPSDADTWGPDLLGRTVFPNGEVFRARLRSRAASFDVRAVDANDNEYIIWGWQPSGDERIVITTDDFVGSRTPAHSDAALSWVTIVNDTNYDVRAVHIVPASHADPGDGEQVLPAGEMLHAREDVRVEIDVERHDTFLYDITLVDVDGDRYVRRDVNLELETEVVFTLDDLEWP